MIQRQSLEDSQRQAFNSVVHLTKLAFCFVRHRQSSNSTFTFSSCNCALPGIGLVC